MPAFSISAGAIRASVFSDLAPHIEARTRAGGEILPLHIGDTYLAPPEGARFAAMDPPELDPALYGYGAITGTMALREAIAQRLAEEKRAGAPVDPVKNL